MLCSLSVVQQADGVSFNTSISVWRGGRVSAKVMRGFPVSFWSIAFGSESTRRVIERAVHVHAKSQLANASYTCHRASTAANRDRGTFGVARSLGGYAKIGRSTSLCLLVKVPHAICVTHVCTRDS